jgi:hypothetical protein
VIESLGGDPVLLLDHLGVPKLGRDGDAALFIEGVSVLTNEHISDPPSPDSIAAWSFFPEKPCVTGKVYHIMGKLPTFPHNFLK